MSPEEMLEKQFFKNIEYLPEEDREIILSYSKLMEKRGLKRGGEDAILVKAVKMFLTCLGISFGLAGGLAGALFLLTPPDWRECPEREDILETYCPQPSKADWVGTTNSFSEYEFYDGTRCFKREGTGSAVCLLP